MRVEDKITNYAKGLAQGLTLESLCMGVGYTGVKLSDGYGGVAFTFRNDLGPSCGVLENAGRLRGTPVEKILDGARSNDLAERTVAHAVANALMNRNYTKGMNISEAVNCDAGDTVGMVGYFCPLVQKFQNASALYVFELDPDAGESTGITQMLSADRACDMLPKCNKVVMTGTSFINRTADELLASCRNAEEIILVGASVPMCPEVLKSYGVSILAGSQVSDADLMLNIVMQGGGGMDISPATDKLLEKL